MSDETMPALFTVLVGDDPERRLATRQQDESGRAESWWDWFNGKEWRPTHDDHIHDPVEVIPEGTPVERVLVLPEVGEVTRSGEWLDVGGLAHPFEPAILDQIVNKAVRTLAAALKAQAFAARAAEPTPEPEPTREQVTAMFSWLNSDSDDRTLGEFRRDMGIVVAEPTPSPLAQAREAVRDGNAWRVEGGLIADDRQYVEDMIAGGGGAPKWLRRYRAVLAAMDSEAALLAATEGGGEA
jgi:hypothetical protein